MLRLSEAFSSCDSPDWPDNFWEGLEDPRNGNAGLHDFHELLVIVLCTVLCAVFCAALWS
jgi:hypothetical protein